MLVEDLLFESPVYSMSDSLEFFSYPHGNVDSAKNWLTSTSSEEDIQYFTNSNSSNSMSQDSTSSTLDAISEILFASEVADNSNVTSQYPTTSGKDSTCINLTV